MQANIPTFDELRRLAIRLAPELAAQPLYLLKQPEDLPGPCEASAYACNQPRPQIKRHLIESGQWRGPGPSIVFVETSESRHDWLQLFVHEVAHLLPARPACDIPAGHLYLKLDRSRYDAEARKSPTGREVNLLVHGPKFTRIALHLWWRSLVLGEYFDNSELCAGSRYQQSAAHFYWLALENEPYRMRDATFSEIVATAPPHEFQELVAGDEERWDGGIYQPKLLGASNVTC